MGDFEEKDPLLGDPSSSRSSTSFFLNIETYTLEKEHQRDDIDLGVEGCTLMTTPTLFFDQYSFYEQNRRPIRASWSELHLLTIL